MRMVNLGTIARFGEVAPRGGRHAEDGRQCRVTNLNNRPFHMKKLLALISIAAVMTACSKAPEAPAAPAPAAPAAVAPAPASATASNDLPKECLDYLDKVNACLSKQSGAAADAIKAGMEQTKSAWATMGSDKAALGSACKAVSDGFAAQAAAMKC